MRKIKTSVTTAVAVCMALSGSVFGKLSITPTGVGFNANARIYTFFGEINGETWESEYLMYGDSSLLMKNLLPRVRHQSSRYTRQR